jgi:serine/threonine protein phosphatase PrpC
VSDTLRPPLEAQVPADLRPLRLWSPAVQIDVSALSHPGLVRPNNEDQYFVTRLSRSLETMLTSLPEGEIPARADEVNYLMVVADGMGGHAAGEVASRMAISALVSLALQVPDWIVRVDEQRAPELVRRARQVVQQVGAVISERGHRDDALQGMGSTLTAVRSLGRDLLIAHVGDSRAYLLRGTTLRRLTKDHTYVQRLVEMGQLDARDVAKSKMRHILTNALGGSDARVDVDVDLLPLQHGDRVMLCSDGLTDLVDDDTIARTLAGAGSSQQACEALVHLALERGGRDNITVIVAAYAFAEEHAPASPR